MKTKHYDYAQRMFVNATMLFDSLSEKIKNDFYFSCKIQYTTYGFDIESYMNLDHSLLVTAKEKEIDTNKSFFIHSFSLTKYYDGDIDEDTDKYLQELYEKINELTTRLADVVEEIKSNDKNEEQ